MRYVKHMVSWILVCALVLVGRASARAQTEVTLLAPMPMQESFSKLIPGFEAKSGYKVKTTYAPTLATRQSVAKGEGLDVTVMVPPYDEALNSGNVDPKSATTLASFMLAIVVAKGSPHPDVSTPDAVKKALLAAKSIVAVDPAGGSAGVAAQAALDKLGIADQVKSKIKWMPVGAVLKAVTSGEADFAFGPYVSDVRTNNAVDGLPLPLGAFVPTDVVGYVSNHATAPAAAKALLQYLTSPEAEKQYESIGMRPAQPPAWLLLLDGSLRAPTNHKLRAAG